MMPSDQCLEYALLELANVQANLDVICSEVLVEMQGGHPVSLRERDALLGAITSMGWAVERVTTAWEAEFRAQARAARAVPAEPA